MANELSNNVNQAIEIIAKGVLSNGGTYDKTMSCTIKEALEGNAYWVTYGALTFKAVALNDAEYKVGDTVCVVVPQGDYNYEKVIIGKYANAQTTYSAVDNPLSRVIPVIDKSETKVETVVNNNTQTQKITIDLAKDTIKAPLALGNYNALGYEIGLDVDVEDGAEKSYSGSIQLLEKPYTVNDIEALSATLYSAPSTLKNSSGKDIVSVNGIELKIIDKNIIVTKDSVNYQDIKIIQSSINNMLINGIGKVNDKEGKWILREREISIKPWNSNEQYQSYVPLAFDIQADFPNYAIFFNKEDGALYFQGYLHEESMLHTISINNILEGDTLILGLNESDDVLLQVFPKENNVFEGKIYNSSGDDSLQIVFVYDDNTKIITFEQDIKYSWQLKKLEDNWIGGYLISHSFFPVDVKNIDFVNNSYNIEDYFFQYNNEIEVINQKETKSWTKSTINNFVTGELSRKELLNLLFTDKEINGDPWHLSPSVKIQGISNFAIPSQLLAADAILTVTPSNLEDGDIFALKDFRIVAGYDASKYDQSKLLLDTSQKVIEYKKNEDKQYTGAPESIIISANFIDGTSYGGEPITWRVHKKSIFNQPTDAKTVPRASKEKEYKDLENAKEVEIADIKVYDDNSIELKPTDDGYEAAYNTAVANIKRKYAPLLEAVSDWQWTINSNKVDLSVKNTFNIDKNDNEVFCTITKNNKTHSGSIIIYASDLSYSFDIKEIEIKEDGTESIKDTLAQQMKVDGTGSHIYKVVSTDDEGNIINPPPNNATWYDKTLLEYSEKGLAHTITEKDSFGKMITAKTSVGHLDFYKHKSLTSIKENPSQTEKNTVIKLNNIYTNLGTVTTNPEDLTGEHEILKQTWSNDATPPEERYPVFKNDVFSISTSLSSATDPTYTKWRKVGSREYYNYYPGKESTIVLNPTEEKLYKTYDFDEDIGFYGINQYITDGEDFVDHLYYIDNHSAVYASMYQGINYDEWHFGDGPEDFALPYDEGGDTTNSRTYYLNIPSENTKEISFSPTIIATEDFTTSVAGSIWENGRQVNKTLQERYYDHPALSQLFDWTVAMPQEKSETSSSSSAGDQKEEEKTEAEQLNELANEIGLSHIEIGNYVGDGESKKSIVVKNFVPKFILIYNGDAVFHWVNGLTNVKFSLYSVSTILKDKTLTLTPKKEGGPSICQNTKGTKYYWVAFG